MKTTLCLLIVSLLAATSVSAQEASAPESSTGAPADAPTFADDAPPITGGVFGLGMVSFRFADVGFGIGGRYQHAIVPGGFLKSVDAIRDELMLEGGIEFHTATRSYSTYDVTWSDLEFTVTALWELWFTDSFAAYPRVGFGFGVGTSDAAGNYFLGVGGAGVIYKLGSFALRAEVSTLSLAGGAGFVF